MERLRQAKESAGSMVLVSPPVGVSTSEAELTSRRSEVIQVRTMTAAAWPRVRVLSPWNMPSS